jgi:plastocyanin
MGKPKLKEGIMQKPLSRIATLLIVAATGAGCGGGDGPGPGPSDPVLTTLEVTPATATLFSVAPGNTAALTVVAKDQDGGAMAGAGSPTFSSSNAAIATVSDGGTVTAVAAGTAQITASLTAGGVTKTGISTVTAQVAPPSAAVTAPAIAFQPATVDVRASGTVTWTFGSVPHDVAFTTAGAPANVPEIENGSASRTFPTNGSYHYRCSIHPPMTGVVHVH